MKRIAWELKLGVVLLALAVLLYFVHYLIFRDLPHILLWGLTNLAFLPISVLFVSLIVERLMLSHERSARLDKLNMLMGTFFSAGGTLLLSTLSRCDGRIDELRQFFLAGAKEWSAADFARLAGTIQGHESRIDMLRVDLPKLKEFLDGRTPLLVGFLENPNLLEYESFTEVLRALFHLSEELTVRNDLTDLPEMDMRHLAGDIQRAYDLLIRQWLTYMKYLKGSFPYLFSLAARMNPLDPNASPVVR